MYILKPNTWVLPTPVKNVATISNICGIVESIKRLVQMRKKYTNVFTVGRNVTQLVGSEVTKRRMRSQRNL